MNFFINANGNIIAVNPSTVNQGTAEVSVIRLFAPIPISSVVTCSYKLPNGVWGVPVKMTAVTTLEDVLSKTNTMTDGMDSFSSFSVWEWSIEDTMTQFFGTVEVQFFCHFGGVGNDYPRLASDIASFSVRKGVPTYIPPINAEDLEFEKLLNAILSALQELQQADAQGAFLSQQYANQALEHAENALVSERNAEQSELNAEKAKEAALGYSYNAKAHANNALINKTHAAVSADDAKTAADNAETAKGDAETAKNAAEAAREAAEIFSATAQTHANNASTDATAAANSATAAEESAKEAKIYAIRAEEVLENVGNFIPGELGEDGKFYPFDKDTGQVSTSALAAPSAGVVYFDLFSNKLYTWDSATSSYILQADLNATGSGGSLDPSVLADYVKFTDYAQNGKAGLVDVRNAFGVNCDQWARLSIVKAEKTDIDTATDNYKPIVASNYKYAVKVGVTTNTETLTDEEQTSACEWLGAVKEWSYKAGQGTLRLMRWDGPKYIDVCARNDPKGDCIPIYGNDGRVWVGEPIGDIYSPDGRNYAANRGWVEDGFVAKDTSSGLMRVYGIAGNGSQVTYPVISSAANVADGRLPRYIVNTNTSQMANDNCVLPTGTPEFGFHAANKEYVDGLQKFTHYITIGTTDENTLINVSLRITNNDNTSFAIKEDREWYNFSLLAQAISETANGAISANGMIRNADTITHLVLRAISSDGSSLKLETYRLDARSLEYIEISGEQYMLIDNVI